MRTGLTHRVLHGTFAPRIWVADLMEQAGIAGGKAVHTLADIAQRIKSDIEAVDEDDFGYGDFFFDYWDEDGYSQRRLVPLRFITAKEIGEVQHFAQKYECVYMAKMCLELQAARQQLYIDRRNHLQRKILALKITGVFVIVFGLSLLTRLFA